MMIWLKRIREYPRQLMLPKLGCHIADAICLFKEDTWRHEHIRIPAFRKFNSSFRDYMYSVYSEAFDEADDDVLLEASDNAPIWVMWWQNPENAPELVKMCLRSIQCNANGHPINIITENNYRKYITLPDHIVKKVRDKKITITHLSDILRVSLLYEYGGLWMDATLFVHRPLPEWIFTVPFYTAKRPFEETYYRYPEAMWNGFFMGTYKHYPLMKAMRDVMFAYWKDHDTLIEYFLIDYIISTAYNHSKRFKQDFDDLPINNNKITHLGDDLNETYDDERLSQFDTDLYFINKLTYKKKVIERTEKGEMTYYGKLLEQYR